MDIVQVSHGVAASKVWSLTGRVVNTPGTTIAWQEVVAINSVRQYLQVSALRGGITSGSLQRKKDIFEFVSAKGNAGLKVCLDRVLLIFGGSSIDGGNYITRTKKIPPKSRYLCDIWEKNIQHVKEKSALKRTLFGVLRDNTLRVPSSATQTEFIKEFKNNKEVLVLESWLTFLTPLTSYGPLKPHQNPFFPLQYSCDPSDLVFQWIRSVLEPVLRPTPSVSEIPRRSRPVFGETTPFHSQQVGQTRVDHSGILNAGKGLYLTEDLNSNRVVASFAYSTTPQSSWNVFHANSNWPHDAGFEGARNMYYFDALFTRENPPKWYYINHSCTPNCATYRNDRRSIFFHTLVPVSAGTELTFKYTDAASFCTCVQCA